jgi:predicted nuclease of predicted toxin-antitoxin system
VKLLLDQNLSHHLAEALHDLHPGSQHVRELAMSCAADEEIWIHAEDSDFQQRSLLRGHPPKVVWIRRGNCSTSQIGQLLRRRHRDLLAFEQDPDASFLVVG